MKKFQFPKFSEKMKRCFLVGACGVLMIFMSVMAYFTSTEQVTNRFTVGDIKIDLVEPSFPGNADPTIVTINNRTVDGKNISYSDANYILPGELVPKDPKIVNTGKNDAIVFMKVEMPVYTDANGTEHEVFVVSSKVKKDATNTSGMENGAYNQDTAPYYEFSKLNKGDYISGVADGNWAYLGTSQNNGDNQTHTYVFGYCKILNPEDEDKKIIDGVNKTDSHNNQNTNGTPYQTENLFNYVMINPEINSIDPDEGNTLYNITKDNDGNIISRTAVPQEIKIYAYGVQSRFLTNDNNSEIAPDSNSNRFNSAQLETIWNLAGFGNLENSKIPAADSHNKYDIPADERDKNYPENGNAWTSGKGTPIVKNNRAVLERKITYVDGIGGNENTYEITYKKIQGETEWTGWAAKYIHLPRK